MYGQKEKESVKKEPHDDLSNIVRLQIHSCELIHTIFITGKSYQVFLGNDVQLQWTVGSLTLVTIIKG